MNLPEITPTLAAGLAIHHHKNNLAMLFLNPDKKVRLLLSYVLYNLRYEMTRFTTAVQYRAMISFCHDQLNDVVQQHVQGELNDEQAKKMAFFYTDKATLAHARLMELAKNGNN